MAPTLPPTGLCPIVCMDQLVHMKKCELEALYRCAEPGPMPEGYLPGKAIPHAGTKRAPRVSKRMGKIWKGKIFYPDDCLLENQWWCHLQSVKAWLFVGPSWLDAKPSIIMDYRGSSPIVWRNVRDELRQVGPNIYLGIMYQQNHKNCAKIKMYFALEVCDAHE